MTLFLYKRLLSAFWLLALVVAFPGDLTTARRESLTSLSCKAALDASLEACSTIRGGDAPEELIRNFVSKSKTSLENFHIHGWRWHTLSLVREAGRLRHLAAKTNAKECESLKQAADYVIGFNMKGLHAIEADLFFPWMKQKLVSVEERELSCAFETVMDQLEDDRKKVAQLGTSIVSLFGIELKCF
jgi:hypothetical protein